MGQIKKASGPKRWVRKNICRLRKTFYGNTEINLWNAAAKRAFESFSSGANQLSRSASALANGASQIHTDMSKVNSGFNIVGNTFDRLNYGFNLFISDFVPLSNESVKLKQTITELISIKSGEDKLKTGSKKLTNQLKNGAKQIQSIHAGQPIYEMMSNPVRLKEQLVLSVPNYGTGLAPYFLSLNLFVGALLLSTIFHIRETNKKASSGMAWFLSKFIFLSAISIFHSLKTNLILIYVIGLDPANKGYLYVEKEDDWS